MPDLTSEPDRLDDEDDRSTRSRRTVASWTVAGVVLAALLAAGWWYTSRPEEPDPATAACQTWMERVGEQHDVLIEIGQVIEAASADPTWIEADRTDPTFLRDRLEDPERSLLTMARWPATSRSLMETLGADENGRAGDGADDQGVDGALAASFAQFASALAAVEEATEADEARRASALGFDARSSYIEANLRCEDVLGIESDL